MTRPSPSTTLSMSTSDPAPGLRINPNRMRTPRPGSVLADVPDSRETALDHVGTGDSEKAPLIDKPDKSRNGANTVFSHTVSQESHFLTRPGGTFLPSDVMDAIRDVMQLEPSKRNRIIFHWVKVVVLLSITVLCCAVLMLAEEEHDTNKLTILKQGIRTKLISAPRDEDRPNIRLYVSGPFANNHNQSFTGPSVIFEVQNGKKVNFTINSTAVQYNDVIDVTEDFECPESERMCELTATSAADIAIKWDNSWLSWQLHNEVLYAFLVLAFVYILIIFELVHRTLAALLGALAALAVLSAMNERPSLEVIIGWIDMETLTLLFGMMIIVAIFSETGFFDYSALKAYKLAKGQIWPLVTLLCVFSAVVSAFLDNVTTVLLMTPITIRLCEVLNLDPRRILIAEVLFSNIGGTATAIGDPPNVIIVGALSGEGITFTTFTAHMFPGIILIFFVGYAFLRFWYRDMSLLQNKDPPDISEMKHEITMWRLTASRSQTVTREETLMRALFMQKAVEMEHVMNRTLHRIRRSERHDMRDTLRRLEGQYYIKDFPLLFKSSFVLFVVILFLFMYSFIEGIHLDIGWIAVLGALWLLVLADKGDMEEILHKVEWSTLLFFAALFVLMEALSELGMIKVIGDGIADMLLSDSISKDNRLTVAVVVIVWISAIASSFIDNIPYTTAMVPVLTQLAENRDLDLPLLPLVISLALGACLGGNGTLIGASCNVVCAGIAEQHGYGFSFVDFFKIGFPMMLVTTTAATVYVLVCHIAMDWNYV